MRGHLYLGVAGAALLCAASALAASIEGYGATSCSAFLSDIAADASGATESGYFNWVTGYISGLNVELEAAGGRALPALTASGFGVPEQKAFVRSYCTDNPSDDFASAADQIFFRLESIYNLNS